MTGLQKEVRREFKAPGEIAEDAPVVINVSLHPAVALQLAQFAKRSTFQTFYDFTEAHLSHEERTERAYQMISGIEAVGGALSEAGYAPR